MDPEGNWQLILFATCRTNYIDVQTIFRNRVVPLIRSIAVALPYIRINPFVVSGKENLPRQNIA
jgi:hypothetical protein